MTPSDDTPSTTGPTPADWAAMKQMLDAFKRENDELRRGPSNTTLGNKPE